MVVSKLELHQLKSGANSAWNIFCWEIDKIFITIITSISRPCSNELWGETFGQAAAPAANVQPFSGGSNSLAKLVGS